MNIDVLASVADEVTRDRLARQRIKEYGMAKRDRALLDYVRDCALAHPIETMALKIRNRAYALQPRLLPFTERVGEASIVFYPTSRLLAPATLVLMYYTAACSERRRWRTLAR